MSTPPASAVPATLITYHLEMTDPAQFRPAFLAQTPGLTLVRWPQPDIAAYRALYSAVGGAWRWRDRLIMPDDDLRAALHSPDCSVWVLRVNGVQAGYFELERQGESTEITYFGLIAGFQGRGLGKHLLSAAIAQAWGDGARPLWVHTCNLDAPAALDNYLQRGFRVYKTTEEPMPERYTTTSPSARPSG
ncbi:MAG TPA: GNAT family N-acetyltransferase [Candidatus Limnocylindrales bacterium]|nr:GNAT family N-acetyltransferase [Candidatus Limnocylindrales bacterium]